MSYFMKDDRIKKMKMGLGAQGVVVSEIYSPEALIFKYFLAYGMIVNNSTIFTATCVVPVKTLGLKFRVNKLIESVQDSECVVSQ